MVPLLFISLVENAFKHGVDNDRPSYISIDIHEIGDQLICRIKNSYFPKSGASDRSGSGIGLKIFPTAGDALCGTIHLRVRTFGRRLHGTAVPQSVGIMNWKLRCMVIDDEPLAVELMESYVRKTPFLELVGSCGSGTAAFTALRRQPVDLLFCDIQMPV